MPGETYFGYTWVPITDEACWIYTYAWNPDQVIADAERARFAKGYGQMAVLGPDFVPLRNVQVFPLAGGSYTSSTARLPPIVPRLRTAR